MKCSQCVQGASKVEDDVQIAIIVVSEEATGATKWNSSINRMDPKDDLRRSSTQIEIEAQVAILRVRTDLELKDSKASRDVARCRALLHKRVINIRCSFLHGTAAVPGYNVAVAESSQDENVELNQESEHGTEAVCTKF